MARDPSVEMMLMRAMHRRALELVKMPLHQREDRYELLLKVYADSARACRHSPAVADALARKFDRMVRMMVQFIETDSASMSGKPN
ncbi:hypothetical protein BH11PSE3_BH11PSE3_17830 [soil metagenome]